MSFRQRIPPAAKLYRWGVLLLIGFLPFTWLLINIGDISIVRDWGYFYEKSILVHQSLSQFGRFALHDPFFMGGQDLIANPQSNVLSPTILFDFIWSSPYAQCARIITMSILGSFGMYKFLLDKGISIPVAFVGTFLFIHGSFFSLHLAEGHIPFAGFYLFGWYMYLMDKLGSFRHFVYFLLLNCFWILDGSIYCFLFGLVFLFFHFLVYRPFGEMKLLWQSIRIQGRQYFSAIVIFGAWLSLRIWSILSLLSGMPPEEEWIKPSFELMFRGVFHPNQQLFALNEKGELYNFHEYGIYLGGISVLIIFFYLLKNHRNKEVKRIVALLLIFIWIGTGIGGFINPYQLIDRLPLFANAHVPSRYLFFVFVLSIILLSKAIDELLLSTRKIAIFILISVLLGEFYVVSQVAYRKVYGYAGSTIPTETVKSIQLSDKIQTTYAYPFSRKYRIYRNSGFEFLGLSNPKTAYKSTYEPAKIQGKIRSVGEKGYAGECFIRQGKGNVTLVSYYPGELTLNIQNTGGCTLRLGLNTNYLLGWYGEDVLCSEKDGLLEIHVPRGLRKRVIVRYGSERRTLFLRLYWIATAALLILLLMFAYRNVRLFKNTKRIL